MIVREFEKKTTSSQKKFAGKTRATLNPEETDINCPDIYIRKLKTSEFSKFGKLKKHLTVWNQVH
jgi:hypothetical protein